MAPKGDRGELEHFLRPTKLLPTDGIVKATASEITKGAKTDVEKARLFGSWEMNWMVYNFAHDVALRGSNGTPIGFLLYIRTRKRPKADSTVYLARLPPTGLLGVGGHLSVYQAQALRFSDCNPAELPIRP